MASSTPPIFAPATRRWCWRLRRFVLNVFIRDGEEVFRTYFVTGHPGHALGNDWSLLDLTPLGRQEDWEDWEDSPAGYLHDPASSWVRRHDEYQPNANGSTT